MFFLAWRRILYHRAVSLLLIAGLTLVVAFPIVVSRTAGIAEDLYMRRARATPLVVGRRANSHQLTLNALYFEGPRPPPVPQRLLAELRARKAGLVIPIINALTAHDYPLIGTSPEYFDFRKLELADGDFPMLLGDCVIGSKVARELNLKAGGALRTDIASFLNVAHEFPFKLTITGVLKPSDSADDGAVFTDTKTVWTVQGFGHGHENVLPNTVAATTQTQPTNEAVAKAAEALLGKGVTEFREVTPENIKSFHFHGDEKEYPLTAVIVVPSSDKAGTMLKGALNAGDEYEAVVPTDVVSELLRLVFNVKRIFDAYFVLTAAGVLAFLAITVLLNLRIRRDEFAVMTKLGCARHTLGGLFAWELALLFSASGILSLIVSQAAVEMLRGYIS